MFRSRSNFFRKEKRERQKEGVLKIILSLSLLNNILSLYIIKTSFYNSFFSQRLAIERKRNKHLFSICLPDIYLSIYLNCIYLTYIYLSAYLSIYIYLYLYLSMYLSAYLCIYLFWLYCLFINLSLSIFFISQGRVCAIDRIAEAKPLYLDLSIYLYIYLSLSLFVLLSLSSSASFLVWMSEALSPVFHPLLFSFFFFFFPLRPRLRCSGLSDSQSSSVCRRAHYKAFP